MAILWCTDVSVFYRFRPGTKSALSRVISFLHQCRVGPIQNPYRPCCLPNIRPHSNANNMIGLYFTSVTESAHQVPIARREWILMDGYLCFYLGLCLCNYRENVFMLIPLSLQCVVSRKVS